MPSDQLLHDRIRSVAAMPGLLAFWSFDGEHGRDVVSRHDPDAGITAFPFLLGQVGDDNVYPISAWPYTDAAAALRFPDGGPFGQALHLNQGHIHGIVPRAAFEGSALSINRRQAFTLVSWLRFTGERHMVGGIWDEGGWDRYGGRRQVALFGGLFGQPGAIAHVSATGAACYPQSRADGAQYARTRAIDGAAIATGEWVSIAMTFDPDTNRVTAYKNGVATPAYLTDPVMADVFRLPADLPANPITFTDGIYHQDSVLLKFSGFDYSNGPVVEHRLAIDFAAGILSYAQVGRATDAPPFRVRGLVTTSEAEPFVVDARSSCARFTPGQSGRVTASLEVNTANGWAKAADDIQYTTVAGAPFTFGRALGVGDHGRDFGSQMDLAGFAVFDRALSTNDLAGIAFTG